MAIEPEQVRAGAVMTTAALVVHAGRDRYVQQVHEDRIAATVADIALWRAHFALCPVDDWTYETEVRA